MTRYTDKRRVSSNVVGFPGTYDTKHTAAVLDDIATFVQRYVCLAEAQASVVALWVVHTHLIHLSNCTPYIAVTSSTKRCGKTRLLETCELLVHAPLRTANITEAALFRALSNETRTLLFDEVDTVFGDGKSRELLRAILNASYRRGSPVYRTKGKGVEAYDVFSPKMIAGIGDLPDTVADRSIPIRLERKTPPTRFRLSEVTPRAEVIKDNIAEVFSSESLLRAIYEHKPALPEHLHDRQQDSWEPLLQIGGVCGWSDQSYRAATELYDEGEQEPWKKKGDR